MGLFFEWKAMRQGMAHGDYPEFVGGRKVGDELPVFIYHRVRPDVFAAHLDHLRQSGYQTWDTEDLRIFVESGRTFTGGSVLLTFDDGLSDLYTAVYPLLKSYRMKAVSFVAPYWIGRNGLITWPQAREMHESGTVDFQSHGLTHRQIPVSSEITGFYNPKTRFYRDWQIPMSETEFAGGARPKWGLPLYRSRSRLSDSPQYLGGVDLDRFCVEQVQKEGADRFFRNPFWEKKLYRRAASYNASHRCEERFETGEEQQRRIGEEIARSKESIEKNLPGKTVIAFSCPFHECGRLTERILRERHFRFVFGGIGPRPDPGGSMVHFRRTSGDFILRLPGRGSLTLSRIMFGKAVRRFKSGPGY